MARHELDLVGEPGPLFLEPPDLLAKAPFGLGNDLFGLGLCLAGDGSGLGLGFGEDPRGLGLRVRLGLVDELLGQQQRALQGVVGHRRCGRRRWRRWDDLVLEHLLQLRDALGGLPQPFTALAELLLETFGLDGRLLEVLVDVVPVVPLQGLPELDRPERIEC